MRTRHFDALQPLCPRCRGAGDGEHPLTIAAVWRGDGHNVLEGALHCTNPGCQQEYPVIDGIPIIVAGVRQFVADNLGHLVQRDDLSANLASMLGDCAGPGSAHDTTRQHLSTYAWDGYGDLDPHERAPFDDAPPPGAVVRCLDAGFALDDDNPAGDTVDLGCSVGRSTFELAARRPDGLVLGIDLNIAMLRLARRVLDTGVVRYPRRRVGIVYDRREFDVHFDDAERVDFWACDALNLPFADDRFSLATAFNLLDCTASPRDFLASVGRVLCVGGRAILTTPYDWSPNATPIEAWLGGHSQRGPAAGAAEPLLEARLTPGAHPQSIPGLQLVAQQAHMPWHARLHDRSIVRYDVHVVVAAAT